MRRLGVWCGLLAGSAAAQVTVFENVNVLPMDRERVLPGWSVVVEDGRIIQVAPAAKAKVPQGAQRIPGAGKYLMPGFAEMHGHLPGPNTPPEQVESILFLYVANGVTTVRAMQGGPAHLELRKRVADGKLLGPILYVAGPAFSGQSAASVEAAQKMVEDQKAAGYDLLKVQEGLSRAVYDAIVATARKRNIPFGGHVAQDVGVPHAIVSRQTSIDHLDNYLDALEAADSPIRNAEPAVRAQQLVFHLDERKIPELAKATAKAGVWNVPTMALWEMFFSIESGEAWRQKRPEVKYLPRPMIDGWVKQKDAQVAKSLAAILAFANNDKVSPRVIEMRRKILKGLQEGGCKIAFGTDSPQLFSVPGFSIHREMAAMVAAGLTPFQVLESGTRNVGEYFGTLSGTVEAGRTADLILLEANPLEDVANVARRAGVMVRGRWIPESEIRERLAKIAAAN